MFFSDVNGRFYPVDKVKQFVIGFDNDGVRIGKVRLADGGSSIEIRGRSITLLEHAGATTVPAEPGTLYLGHEDDGTVWFEPILAWIIPPADAPIPVTALGPDAGVVNDRAIVHANGSIASTENNFANLKDYLTKRGLTSDQVGSALAAFAEAKR